MLFNDLLRPIAHERVQQPQLLAIASAPAATSNADRVMQKVQRITDAVMSGKTQHAQLPALVSAAAALTPPVALEVHPIGLDAGRMLSSSERFVRAFGSGNRLGAARGAFTVWTRT